MEPARPWGGSALLQISDERSQLAADPGSLPELDQEQAVVGGMHDLEVAPLQVVLRAPPIEKPMTSNEPVRASCFATSSATCSLPSAPCRIPTISLTRINSFR